MLILPAAASTNGRRRLGFIHAGLTGHSVHSDRPAATTCAAVRVTQPNDENQPKGHTQEFWEQGFTIYRGALTSEECERAVAATYRAVEAGKYVGEPYPAPGKITVARNDWTDPDLAFFAEHDKVIHAIEPILAGPAKLQAFVSYLRTPEEIKWESQDDPVVASERLHHDGHGASSTVGNRGKHCDYKRWRPVGSSMEWLFVIIPLTDFDSTRPLLVAPGSHLLRQTIDQDEPHGLVDATPPDKQDPLLHRAFVDPQLRKGDLLIMHSCCWHQAPPNYSGKDRIGIFNKYSSTRAPPAAGHFPFDDSVGDALAPSTRYLLPTSPGDLRLLSTRLIVERERQYLQVKPAGGEWQWPGGVAWEEQSVGWDEGAKVHACSTHFGRLFGVEMSPPWMTWIGDYAEEHLEELVVELDLLDDAETDHDKATISEHLHRIPEVGSHCAWSDAPLSPAQVLVQAHQGGTGGLCRTYGYTASPKLTFVCKLEGWECRWVDESDLAGSAAVAVEEWSREGVVRGRAVANAGGGHPFGSLS